MIKCNRLKPKTYKNTKLQQNFNGRSEEKMNMEKWVDRHSMSYLRHTVIRLSRLPDSSSDRVVSIAAEERELQEQQQQINEKTIHMMLNKHRDKNGTSLTLRTQWTVMFPVVGHCSNVRALISISSHFILNSSSQNRSLTISAVASSKIVRLRYCGGPLCQNNSKQHHKDYKTQEQYSNNG